MMMLAATPFFDASDALPNGDDALREQRLCRAIRRYWAERGYFGVALTVRKIVAPELRHSDNLNGGRLYGIRSDLTGGMPTEMRGTWQAPKVRPEVVA